MHTKKTLRARILAKLKSQSPEDRSRRSLAIQKKLLRLRAFKKAQCVCCYVSLPAEVDTRSVIERSLEMGKRVVVPLSDMENKELKLYQIKDPVKDLTEGVFGILEPVPQRTRLAKPEDVDCVIVPAVAFDKKKHRLGRGHGFYDRFLKTVGSHAPKIGLGFSFQVVSKIPRESHDEQLDFVLTD